MTADDEWEFLYHWAPSSRRKGIARFGLVPGKRALDGTWKAPFICLSPTVMHAWAGSGLVHPDIGVWDLWQVSTESLSGWEVLELAGAEVPEIRVYERIYKRDVQLVAIRHVHLTARG